MGVETLAAISIATALAGTGASLYGQKRQKDAMNRAEDARAEEESKLNTDMQVRQEQTDATKAAQLARQRQRLLSGAGRTAITPYGAIGLQGYTGAGGRQLIGTNGTAA